MGRQLLTLGRVAVKVGVPEHQLRRLCKLGLVPFDLAGRIRLFSESDVPAIRAALIAAGYLRSDAREVARAS
jgi:DNA-binding transcriptional MerR regulator